MFKTRTFRFCLVLLTASLVLTACGPSAEQIRARDEARAAALAAEARIQSLMNEFETLTNEIPEKEALIIELEAELAELQAEYEALGGTTR
jgi:peptidoglycan hydrolase CwlO-like protein